MQAAPRSAVLGMLMGIPTAIARGILTLGVITECCTLFLSSPCVLSTPASNAQGPTSSFSLREAAMLLGGAGHRGRPVRSRHRLCALHASL